MGPLRMTPGAIRSRRHATHEDAMVSRREFLRVGGLGVVGLSVATEPGRAAPVPADTARLERRSVIFILMTGGASPFETFDPKPDAPAEIRGPLAAISTTVPGTRLSESLPRLAERAGRFALLRSLTHDAAPIHETGLQLLQTGCLAATRSPRSGALRGAS
ncbi:MAG: DUF1501 domain-containing protein, partial [Planctomycetaceae bacterium]